MTGVTKNGVSVIICCYNSELLLSETLKYMAGQNTSPDIEWELIIVNNNSSDKTAEVARMEWESYSLVGVNFKVVSEPQPGLNFARIKGFKEAAYDIIIFCDDDNWLCNNYIETAYNILNQNKKIGVLGGRSESISNVPFPCWWPEYRHGYAVGEQAVEAGCLDNNKHLWGAGLVTKKHLLSKVYDKGFPSLLTGRKAGELSSGEDVEICARILLMGYSLYYDDRLLLQHFISEERLSESYRDKMFEGHAKGVEMLRPYHRVIELSHLSFIQKIKSSIKEIGKIILTPFRKTENRNNFISLAGMWTLPFLTNDPIYKKILNYKKRVAHF